MSRENVEVVRRWLASTDQGPEAVQSAVTEFCDPDVDYYPIRKLFDEQPSHGSEELSQFLARWLQAWSRLEMAVEELIDVGHDRVLACVRLRAEGRGSEVNLDGDLYQCVWLRHGRLFRVEDHLTLGGALHALGLSGDTLEAAGLRD